MITEKESFASSESTHDQNTENNKKEAIDRIDGIAREIDQLIDMKLVTTERIEHVISEVESFVLLKIQEHSLSFAGGNTAVNVRNLEGAIRKARSMSRGDVNMQIDALAEIKQHLQSIAGSEARD